VTIVISVARKSLEPGMTKEGSATKKPAVISDGRLLFGTQQTSAAVTPRNAY